MFKKIKLKFDQKSNVPDRLKTRENKFSDQNCETRKHCFSVISKLEIYFVGVMNIKLRV